MATRPPLDVSLATSVDVAEVAVLLDAYMRETFRVPWAGTEGALAASIADGSLAVWIVRAGERAVGFAATVPDYDLHHCVRGVRVVDLYATPDARHLAVGVRLLAHVAQAALDAGQLYVRGEAVERRGTRRLFARVATRFGDTYNVSAPQLELVASLRDCSPREMARRIRIGTG